MRLFLLTRATVPGILVGDWQGMQAGLQNKGLSMNQVKEKERKLLTWAVCSD